MRAANHIKALWSVHQMFSEPHYQDARRELRTKLAAMMSDPEFRAFASRQIRGEPSPDAPQTYVATVRAATLIGNTFEALGNMIITGLIDRQIFLRGYAWIVDATWRLMEPYIELVRSAERGDGLYEDFEFITACARDWIKRNPVSYPSGYPRILPSFEPVALTRK